MFSSVLFVLTGLTAISSDLVNSDYSPSFPRSASSLVSPVLIVDNNTVVKNKYLESTTSNPTSFPTAQYEMGILGSSWWYTVTCTAIFTGEIQENPNEATDYALTFAIQDNLNEELASDVLEVGVISKNPHDDFHERHVKIWCLSRSTSMEVVNVLQFINKNPLYLILPIHENGLRGVTGVSLVDIQIITNTEEPPYVSVHQLSPLRIVYVILATVALFYVGVRMIDILWSYKKEHFHHIRDPYDCCCGCIRWVIATIEASENGSAGYVRSSSDDMDTSTHSRNLHRNDVHNGDVDNVVLGKNHGGNELGVENDDHVDIEVLNSIIDNNGEVEMVKKG